MEKGMSPRQAVEKAYKLHPVMKTMQDELAPLLVTEAMDGGAADVPKEELHKAMLKGWAEDGLTLSQRTTKGRKAVVESVTKTIKKTMDECQSVYQLAKNIFDGYGKGGVIPKQDIPEFMDRLTALAVEGKYEGNTFKRAMRAAERNVNKLTTGGMKAAYRGVLAAVKAGNEEKISKAITVAAEENTRYFAWRIARTEMAMAYADGVFYKWMKDPDCVAFKWKLSSRHPCDDICDLYAHADLWGMGEGIFPKDSVPKLPVHPNCMCRLVPVMEGSLRLKSEEPKEMLESGGMKYIRTLTTMQRQSLLGVNGSKAVMGGKAKWMDVARGYSKEVMTSRISDDMISVKTARDELATAGVIGNLEGIPDDVRDPMEKEIVSVLHDNPKFAEYVKVHGLTLAAKPLSFAYGQTRFMYKPGNGLFIDINTKAFQNADIVKKTVSRQEIDRFKMPASEDEALHYTISHELGHAIEAVAVYSLMDSMDGFIIYSDTFEMGVKKIKGEILDIAHEIDKSVSRRRYKKALSIYGQSNPYEFFAECHANMRCGKPNTLGLAMKEWLRRWNNGKN